MYNLSEYFKKARLERNLTQKQVADGIGISEQSYQRYEYGKVVPSANILLALANFFDVPLDFLVGRPPYDNWELVMQCRKELCEFIEDWYGIESTFTEHLPMSDFVRLFSALFARVAQDPETGHIAFYPSMQRTKIKLFD